MIWEDVFSIDRGLRSSQLLIMRSIFFKKKSKSNYYNILKFY